MSLVGTPAEATQNAKGASVSPTNVISYSSAFFAPLGLDTAYDMVLRLPGFAFDGGSSVRGFGGAAGNVLIDGQRPTTKTDDLASILRRIPSKQVERIDLIRGATPGIDLQGKTVVANVILRKSGGFSGTAIFAQYTVKQGYEDPQVRLEGAWQKNGRKIQGSLLSFSGHLNNEGSGPHEIRGPNGELLDRSETRNSEPNHEYKATASLDTPLAGGQFDTNFTFDAQPQRLTSVDLFGHAGRQVEEDHQTLKTGELGVHFTHGITPNLSAELIGLQQLSRTSFRSDFSTALQRQQFRLNDRQSESVGRLVLHWQASLSLTAEGGGEFAFNTLNARTRFSVDRKEVALPAADVRVTERRGEAFETVTWRVLPSLSIEAGLRVETSTISAEGDVINSRSLTFAKPRLIATWTPTGSDQLRVRIEREVGQLAFSQFVASASLNATGVVAGNPNLLPQQDWAYEAAFEHHFWRDAALALTIRRLALNDVIDLAPVFSSSGTFDAPGNIGTGVETDMVGSLTVPLARLGLKGFTLRALGTWRSSRVTDPTTRATRRISNQHALDAEFHLTQEIPNSKFSWGGEIFTSTRERSFRFNEIDTNRLGGLADIYVDYKLRPGLVFRFEVVTHNRYDVERALFGGPRNTAGLSSLDIQKRKFGPLIFTRLRKTF